jgi:hypothetical protein
LLKPKVAKNVANSSAFFIFSKNHNELPKVSPIGKKSPNLVTLLTHSVSKWVNKQRQICNTKK